jgi:hypothetical protein
MVENAVSFAEKVRNKYGEIINRDEGDGQG